MKKVIVVTLYEDISDYYRKQLENVFGNLIQVENCYIENNQDEINLNGDLIITSSSILYDHVKKLNKKNIKTIVINRTFTKEGFNKLKKLDYNSEMLFVSNFHEIAVECISKLYELGIKNIKLIPYSFLSTYNEINSDIKTAVIAGKTRIIPDFIKIVVDVGDRVMDLSTITDIGVILKIEKKQLYRILERYQKKLIFSDYGISQIISDSSGIKKQLSTILNFTADSIIGVDLEGRITEYNDASERIYDISKDAVVGMNIRDVFPMINISDILAGERNVNNELVKINDIMYVVNKYGIYDSDDLIGIVIFSKKYIELENEHVKLRSKLMPSGHVAKYTMDSILGNSSKIIELKKIAFKMARSSSTVLISGESGTGKEVFAQAIHNASNRAHRPFIAINCSALTSSLLESELFGYEEGAFTGAKKGGKIGLFEMADKGTIFLDEIGEMPFELQAKLLRVLMEKEVMRIGGANVIKVNVRVIAATNKNLIKLVNENLFREDLYYRINVLPLQLPPLRERKEDIPILVNVFLNTFEKSKQITPRIMRIMMHYDWPGNIRELHNCIEYMYQLSDEKIQLKNIPNNIRYYNKDNGDGNIININKTEEQILAVLMEFNKKNVTAGRKKVRDYLKKEGKSISEQDVRYMIKRMEDLKLIRITKGRKGSFITDLGIKYLSSKR